MTPLATTTVTIKLECLSGGRVGLGVYTEGGSITPNGKAALDAILDTLQAFCDLNNFPVNVRRPMQ